MDESDVYVREEGDRPVEHSPRGRYIRFDIRLGTGAYKSVYKAYDTDQGIDVAWNAIDIGLLPSTEKTRIIQEVQLLQKLEHKNIINFYGSWFSKEKNQVVFITEIMTSGTLKSYIKRVQYIKWKIIKRWCIQILEGLHYLHNQHPPVIHRDLKCDNIFVNGNTGDLRIGDLGLSTQLAVDKRSKAQSVLGTPEFMAPELYDESYDEKVDVYAFGMCVLEMVTKEVPYSECINPAQIYKKVTAGIRPKGLQRVVSQAARDFIELCLSRGNGLVDVTAQYLLDHPFLKAQDDDNDMVECLDEDKVERDSKVEQQRLERVAEESFAEEFNMEGRLKDGVVLAMSERRNSMSFEMKDELTTLSVAVAPSSGSNGIAVALIEEKNAGTHALRQVSSEVCARDSFVEPHAVATTSVSLTMATVASTPAEVSTPPSSANLSFVTSPSLPVISEMVSADEPLMSEKSSSDTHVDRFLATLPGSESAIQNTRINIMGGRGHRLDLENDSNPEYAESPVDSPVASDTVLLFTEDSGAVGGNCIKVEPPNSAPGLLTPSLAPHAHIPSLQLPEPVLVPQTSLVRRASIHGPSAAAAVAAALADAGSQLPLSQPSSTNARKRVKRHEIKATKDPDNEHSILLSLRIMIDGKSKEIKFPFNLFADSTYEVTCELAVDVGIREPDLEDIADSIRFLVTEGKINNLSDVQEDVWEEAPEPYSFSSKPFPNVLKMTFVHMPPGAYQPQQPFLLNSSGLDHAQSVLTASTSSLSTSGLPSGLISSNATTSTTTIGAPMSIQDVVLPGLQDSLNTANLSDPSSTLMVLDSTFPLLSSSGSSTGALSAQSSNDVARSPPRPGLAQTASDSMLTKETLLNILEMRARGVSMGSMADPAYVQQIQQLEDCLKLARTTFDERESSLEAAIRSEEEKHQREIERFRKKMEEFDKQRAAIARQQNGDGVTSLSAMYDDNLSQGETLASTNERNSSAMLVAFNNEVNLAGEFEAEFSLPSSGQAVSLAMSECMSAAAPMSKGSETVKATSAMPSTNLLDDYPSVV